MALAATSAIRSTLAMPNLLRTPESPEYKNDPPKSGLARFPIMAVWIIWAISSLYLIAMSGYYEFLSVIFTGYSLRSNVQPRFGEYIASAALGSPPLLVSLAFAIVGFFLWRRARFRIPGFFVISIEAFLALYLFVDPVAMLSFVEYLR